MLDAYIIERIQREQEQRDSQREPLRKEPAPAYERRPANRKRWDESEDANRDRGVVIIEM